MPKDEEQDFQGIVDELLNRIWQDSNDLEVSAGSRSEDAIVAFQERAKRWLRFAKTRRTFEGWSEDTASTLVRNNFSDIVKKQVNFWFDDRPITDSSRKIIEEICEGAPSWASGGNYSEIVFTGFGSEDLLPQMTAVAFHGILGTKVRHNHIRIKSIDLMPSYYEFFGQWDASVQFIRGLDSGLEESILNFAEEQVRKLMASQTFLFEEDGDEEMELLIKEKVQIARSALEELIAEKSKKEFVEPLMKVISLSPEADLARLAKSLIEIQAIRQAINETNPTVGGPIDVAVISKTRGFRWVQHKSLDSFR
jgi:hypothetical protein